MKKGIKMFRTSVGLPSMNRVEADRLAKNTKVKDAFPGLGRVSRKKILELAIQVGLKEIARQAKA